MINVSDKQKTSRLFHYYPLKLTSNTFLLSSYPGQIQAPRSQEGSSTHAFNLKGSAVPIPCPRPCSSLRFHYNTYQFSLNPKLASFVCSLYSPASTSMCGNSTSQLGYFPQHLRHHHPELSITACVPMTTHALLCFYQLSVCLSV